MPLGSVALALRPGGLLARALSLDRPLKALLVADRSGLSAPLTRPARVSGPHPSAFVVTLPPRIGVARCHWPDLGRLDLFHYKARG